MKSASVQRPIPACGCGVMFGPKKVPKGVFKARPPAYIGAPSLASVWQPTHPPAFERYKPRFASPSAKATATKSESANAPASVARFTPAPPLGLLLLLAERLVATATGLADRADLGLDRSFVARAAHVIELRRLGFQAFRCFLEFRGVAEHCGQRGALHVLGARIEP